MTDLTDPVQVDILATTPAEPVAPVVLPAQSWIKRRRSQRFTLRTDAAVRSYASWERAVGAARSFGAGSGRTSTVTDDNSGTRFDVAPDGCASPSPS
jgi:hypothetical protein